MERYLVVDTNLDDSLGSHSPGRSISSHELESDCDAVINQQIESGNTGCIKQKVKITFGWRGFKGLT